jgi:AIPR protein
MKIQDFKNQLTASLKTICKERGWIFDNPKQRGMAFEDWCFNLFAERYPTAENELEQCVIRGDDFSIDIVFESKETEEIYILQCKHPKIAASDPVEEEEVKSFFATYELLRDHRYLDQRNTNNQKIVGLGDEFDYWRKQNFTIHFIFISSGKATDKTSALADKYNRDYQNQGVQFDVWDISRVKDEFVAIKSVEEQYPELVVFLLGDDHYMVPAGEHENITFVVRGTRLKEIAIAHKDSLFNWNIRRFLGKKGEVNAGLTETLEKEPKNFFYYNNGISALCDRFDLNQKNKELKVHKLQIVNGAQTLGAIKNASNDNLSEVLVLVKLTAVKHSSRERGIAAGLIKTNNTQNKLREPDFRSNDPIQQWLEVQFKNTKPRGELIQIAYGRKRPYPRATSGLLVLKLQDLGKIRYAWYHDPRIPIASPARLFQLAEDNGLYGFAFGVDGEAVDVWTDSQFRDCLLAIHTYNKINLELHNLQESNVDLKQITRLRYYGLKLFKIYFDQVCPTMPASELQQLYQFGGKYNDSFVRPAKIICHTLSQSYRDILKQNEGTAFSLPRDSKVWDLVRSKFEDNVALIREIK